jgi:outer membrane protein OmpA-like peptidoglycan-associated protein
MSTLLRLGAVVMTVGIAAPALAQTADDTAAPAETRPATNTFLGDTGLWFVPTGEVLPRGRASGGGYYTNQDFTEGFMDISNFSAVAGYGIGGKAEVFGAFQFYRRIDTDRRPVLASGAPVNYPNPISGWETGVGDIWVGGKFNLMSEADQQPVAAAVRGVLKLPTASYDDGLGTGQVDFLVDGIVSKEINQRVEASAYVGFAFRGEPDDVDTTGGLRYGIGFAGPTRDSRLRVVGELFGERYFDHNRSILTPVAEPFDDHVGIRPPQGYHTHSPFEWNVGADYFLRDGLFIGASWRGMVNFDSRSTIDPSVDDETGDNQGIQFRVGYHPGVRVYVPPPAPREPPPPPPANRSPTVKARCEPCVVQICQSATVTADAQDPDGDTLSYKWSVPTGKLANPADRQTLFTAPCEEGSIQVTVTVDDGKGGTATDTLTIQVVRPPVREYTFEDVHFDFDRYSLRAEATRVLDEVIKAMADNPELRIEIEGHTCNIGTAEYNLALGERRATSVRDYLTSRGVSTGRLQTVSYGEERPKHDNAREDRRAGLVVRIQR